MKSSSLKSQTKLESAKESISKEEGAMATDLTDLEDQATATGARKEATNAQLELASKQVRGGLLV